MRKICLITIALLKLLSAIASAQTIDTLLNVNDGCRLHFTIIKGKGDPILFESGAGDNGSIWKGITPQIAEITDATVITYDRLGFGKDSWKSPIGFGNEIKALELGLQKLGYANMELLLVSHSMGGMYSSYYASRHPNEVKAAVFIEASTTCSWSILFKNSAFISKNKNDLNDLNNMLDTVIKYPMPLDIPLIDIVRENSEPDVDRNTDSINNYNWFNCHEKFVAQSSKRKSLLAYGCGHGVFLDNPSLVINTVVTQYANYVAPEQKAIIFEKAYALTLKTINENNKNELKYGRSEEELNEWGYFLLGNNEIKKAIEIFKFNVTLNPESWNVYDSLGEAYLKAGEKGLAIKNYKKSLQLNPKNEHAAEILSQVHKSP